MNHNFGKLENESITYASDALVIVEHHHEEWVDPDTGEKHETDWDTKRGCCPPTAADYAIAGYLPIVTAIPDAPAPDGYHYEARGWEVKDGQICRVYEAVIDPTIYRRWTPLALKRAAVAQGKWDAVKAVLVAADAYDDFVMAQYEAEDDADFVRLMTALRTQFGDAWVDEILASAEEA